jgi:hypothetical protein
MISSSFNRVARTPAGHDIWSENRRLRGIYRKFESITFQTPICFESKHRASAHETFSLIRAFSRINETASSFTDWFQPNFKRHR